jgi:hypothetical protein
MKKMIPVLGLSAMLALGGCNSNSLTTLQVTPGAGRTYQISQQQGERDLDILARTAKKEEMFYFYGSEWKDTALLEYKKATSNSLENVLSLLPKQLAEGSTIFFYHFHPLRIGNKSFVYCPSDADIHSHVLLKKSIRKFKANAESIVFDGMGIWRYDVTSSLESEIPLYDNPIELAENMGQPNAMAGVSVEFNRIKYQILRNNSLSREVRINMCIEAFEKVGVILKYTPIEDDSSK